MIEIPQHNEELIVLLEAARTEDNMSQARIAKAIGCDGGTISKWVNRKFPGDVASLEKKIMDYLDMRENTRRIKTKVYKTGVTESIASAINLARTTGDREGNVSIISGNAGHGKTKGIELYCAANPAAVLATLNDESRDGRGVANAIMAAMATSRSKKKITRWEFLVSKFKGSKRPILLDNAHRLNSRGLAWVFDFQDETGCPIILVGNPEIIDLIKTNDQFLSRFGYHTIVHLDPKEISELAHRVCGQYFDDADTVRDLTAIIGTKQGGLRSVKKQAILAQALKDNGIADPRKAFQAAHGKLIRDYTLPA